MFRGARMRKRALISQENAKRIGYVWDIEFDEISGCITAIIAVRGGFLKRMLGMGEVVIPWSAVSAISEEFVIVDMYSEVKK